MAKDYQPNYPDQAKLNEAMRELRNTTPVTTFDNVDNLRQRLGELNESGTKLYIAGRCANGVRLDTPIQEPAGESLALYSLIQQETGDSQILLRDARGQSAKPRSEDKEAGSSIDTYKGDMINGLDLADRTPDPDRMVATAVQARDVEELLLEQTAHHLPHAHETLLLPYEESFVHEKDGKKYLLSADLPWIGERTRRPDGPHVELLSQVENPVGVKISSEASAKDIIELSQKLNPDHQPGKLVFMLRLGLDKMKKLPEILNSIKDNAPQSLIMCDPMHGNTRKLPDSTNPDTMIKARLVGDIIEEVRVVAGTCQSMGLTLHGLHLEAMARDDIKECIDEPGEVPAPTAVDPNLNLTQLRRVIRETRDYL